MKKPIFYTIMITILIISITLISTIFLGIYANKRYAISIEQKNKKLEITNKNVQLNAFFRKEDSGQSKVTTINEENKTKKMQTNISVLCNYLKVEEINTGPGNRSSTELDKTGTNKLLTINKEKCIC